MAAFSAKRTFEVVDPKINFTKLLNPGDTITSASTWCVVSSGSDATPSSLLFGAPSIQGVMVVQLVRAGIAGNTYEIGYGILTAASLFIASSGTMEVTT